MKKCVVVAAVAALAFLVCAGNVLAADANKPAAPKEAPKSETVTIKGTVSETKDKDGNVTEVKLTTKKDVVYQITLDEKGKELCKMAGKTVKATGTVETKGEVKWLKVESCTEVVKKPAVEKPVEQPKK